MSRLSFRSLALSLVYLLGCGSVFAAGELVDVKSVDPTIEVELRYAGTRNMTGRALYLPNTQALLRPSVAARLIEVQSYLQVRGYRLKIWDAYRPKAAHDQLWQFSPNNDYVADPTVGGSLHSWGVALDATIVREDGSEVAMPTDFDDFTPAAMLRYVGTDLNVANNLHMLQRAMARAGFYGMRTEWWHFVSKDWQKYKAVPEPGYVAPKPAVPALAARKRALPAATTVRGGPGGRSNTR